MKKRVLSVLLCLIVSASCSGCGWEIVSFSSLPEDMSSAPLVISSIPGQSGPDLPSSGAESSRPDSRYSEQAAEAARSFRESVFRDSPSLILTSWDPLESWVQMYLSACYPDTAVDSIAFDTGFSVTAVARAQVSCMVYTAALSDRETPLQITLALAEIREGDRTITYLSGAYDDTCLPQEVMDAQALYDYVREDPRFSDLPPYPDDELPDGMQAYCVSELLPEYADWEFVSSSPIGLTDSVAALAFRQRAVSGGSYTRSVILLFDLDRGVQLLKKEIPPEYSGRLSGLGLSAADGVLWVRLPLESGGADYFSLTADGTWTDEGFLSDAVVSPNARYAGYTDPDTNDCYLIDNTTGNRTLLRKGDTDPAPSAWVCPSVSFLTDTEAVYTVYTYETFGGYGIYDLATAKNLSRDSAFAPFRVTGRRLHLTAGLLGMPAGYRFIDLDSPGWEENSLPGVDAFIAEHGISSECSLSLSPAGDRLFLLYFPFHGDGDYGVATNVAIFDAVTGELLDHAQTVSYRASLQYLSNATDHTLFLGSEGLAGWGDYFFTLSY